MARSGVSYQDVVKAAEAIKAQELEPTVDRVRENLGTGSKSTIAPLLKRWRTENDAVEEAPGLPQDLVEALRGLCERVNSAAELRIQQCRDALDQEALQWQKELSAGQEKIADSQKREHALNEQVAQLVQVRDEQQQRIVAMQVGIAKTETQRDEANARVSALKGTVVDLKKENSDVREHFDHFQQRTSEDRQYERDQYRISRQQLEEQNADLQNRLLKAEAQIAQLQGVGAGLSEELVNSEKHTSALNVTLARSLDDVAALKSQLDHALRKVQASDSRVAEQVNVMEGLQHNLANLNHDIAVLTLTLDNKSADLQALMEEKTALWEENKVLLQDKSLIQGQYAQLQKLQNS